MQSGFIPFYLKPNKHQIHHVQSWIDSLPACAVVTSNGVSYVVENELLERLLSFMDGYNYMCYLMHDRS